MLHLKYVSRPCARNQNMLKATHVLGSWSGGAPFRWKIPSMNTPFFPVHFIKKFPCSKNISKCTREMKLERPIFTSTSPLLLFRPILIFCWRIVYSRSLPSKRAIAVPLLSRLHATLDGLAGADLRANNAKASLSEGWCIPDIARSTTPKWQLEKRKTSWPVFTSSYNPECTARVSATACGCLYSRFCDLVQPTNSFFQLLIRFYNEDTIFL